MCQMVAREAKAGNPLVLRDARRAVREDPNSDYVPADAREFAHRIFCTCYMGTKNSSAATRERAKQVAEQIGAYHLCVGIDSLLAVLHSLLAHLIHKTPRFRVEGGTESENAALQNLQARVRMVFSYLLAQILPWARGKSGSLLVLASANVDESLRGYFTKYDCSSADINPIGSISKVDLSRFLRWGAEKMGYSALHEVLAAKPTAELEPITESYTQEDEADMGLTYEELSRFGRLRKIHRCGPLSMFEKLVHEWQHLPPGEVATKVKHFFYHYALNRHKMTTLTPAYHAESYSPEDNRFDLRPFLYRVQWPWQFRKIDELVKRMESDRGSED
jgi:NAD+ synthase (glutamine-hydrolysing)